LSKASQLRHRAQEFLKKGKLDKAIEEYKKLVQVESRNPNLYNELGDLFLKAEDRVQAVSCLEKASVNYEKVALYNNAVAVCKKILRVVPNRLETIFKLGELKAKQKFEGEAAGYFSQYLQRMLGESPGSTEGVQEKLDLMLEYMRDREDIIGAVAELYGRLGFKVKAAGLFAGIVRRLEGEGESRRADIYRNSIESLKPSLSSEELAVLDKQLSSAGEGCGDLEKDLRSAVDEVFETAEEVDMMIPTDSAADPGTADGGDDLSYRADGTAATAGSKTGGAVSPEEVSSVPGGASASRPAMDLHEIPGAEGAGKTAQHVAVEERAVPEVAEDVTENEVAEELFKRAVEEQPDPGADATSDGEAEDFAREITSDVEEDDYRSHYDLGMAYIEMALFDEAVKELQIASRSEQLHLRSIEMIGHCFLMQNNPRLAVKQLQRGLAKASEAGVESLGIHYNLGLAYEMLDEADKAREYFEEVYIVDVTFRDVAEKMKKYGNAR